MNKAFTRDDANSDPVLIPPRAPLPEGVVNYVTQRGLETLREELSALERMRDALDSAPRGEERTRERAQLAGRLRDLEERIAGAVLVDPRGQPRDCVRFGARVTVVDRLGERRYEIVGVDEADARCGKLAFTAPLARALLGRSVGDTTSFRSPRGEEELEIVTIDYAVDDP